MLECFSMSDDGLTLIWRVRPDSHFECKDRARMWNARNANRVVGVELNAKGYSRIRVDGRVLMLHRVLWKMHTGRDPKDEIDHIDGDITNNRVENLREATRAQNVSNVAPRLKGARFKGIYKEKSGSWGARIGHLGKLHYLGTYADDIDAAKAYDEAAVRFHGEFARTNAAMGLV